jgi:hypothetical protein
MTVAVSQDFAEFIGRRIRISRGIEAHDGTLKGLSDIDVATSSTSTSRTWELDTDSETIGFGPDWLVTPLD